MAEGTPNRNLKQKAWRNAAARGHMPKEWCCPGELSPPASITNQDSAPTDTSPSNAGSSLLDNFRLRQVNSEGELSHPS